MERHGTGAAPVQITVWGPLPSPPAGVQHGDPADEPVFRTTRIGPYELINEVGRGGMGIVYLARRADGQYERYVALKVARGTLHDPGTRERLLAERGMLAGFSHPNIATLYDGASRARAIPTSPWSTWTASRSTRGATRDRSI